MVGVQNLALCTVNPMRNETHTLNIVTTGLSGQDYDWFTLNVAGSPWELNPTPLYNNRDDYWTVPDVGKNGKGLIICRKQSFQLHSCMTNIPDTRLLNITVSALHKHRKAAIK